MKIEQGQLWAHVDDPSPWAVDHVDRAKKAVTLVRNGIVDVVSYAILLDWYSLVDATACGQWR